MDDTKWFCISLMVIAVAGNASRMFSNHCQQLEQAAAVQAGYVQVFRDDQVLWVPRDMAEATVVEE